MKPHIIHRCRHIAISTIAHIACILMCCTTILFAQTEKKEVLNVKIDQIISTQFPEMKAYVVVQNAKGEIVSGLAPTLFNTRIDSMEIKAKINVIPFTLKEEAIDYSILFSNNGIMEGEPLDFQKNAILQFIDIMKPADTLSLYTIGTEATALFEEQKKDSIDFAIINATTVTSDQPRLYDSLTNILRKVERRKTPRKIIIVISDGRDQNSRFTKDQLNITLAETGIPVYALGIRVLSNQSLSNLNEFSSITGATYVYSATLKALPENLKKIADIITHCYVISYKIKNFKADDSSHYLEISVNERDASGKGQKTFTAVKIPVPRWMRWLILGILLALIIALIIISIVRRITQRKKMGITKHKCPDCKSIMKDSWDSCPFCKYVPSMKKKKKKDKKNK